jgi:hypothetical protein
MADSWLDYHPLIGPFREANGGGDEEADWTSEELSPGVYDNSMGGDSMCSECGHAECAEGGDCDCCGGIGTGISKSDASA